MCARCCFHASQEPMPSALFHRAICLPVAHSQAYTHTPNPQPSTLNPQPSTLNPTLKTRNPMGPEMALSRHKHTTVGDVALRTQALTW